MFKALKESPTSIAHFMKDDFSVLISLNELTVLEIEVGAVWPSWLRERQDPRGQGFESPPEQSFAKMQTLVLAEPRDYTAESVLAPTQGSLRKS